MTESKENKINSLVYSCPQGHVLEADSGAACSEPSLYCNECGCFYTEKYWTASNHAIWDAMLYKIYEQTSLETDFELALKDITQQSFDFLRKYPFDDPQAYERGTQIFGTLLKRNLRLIQESVLEFASNGRMKEQHHHHQDQK